MRDAMERSWHAPGIIYVKLQLGPSRRLFERFRELFERRAEVFQLVFAQLQALRNLGGSHSDDINGEGQGDNNKKNRATGVKGKVCRVLPPH